jgi:hypothetical protein
MYLLKVHYHLHQYCSTLTEHIVYVATTVACWTTGAIVWLLVHIGTHNKLTIDAQAWLAAHRSFQMSMLVSSETGPAPETRLWQSGIHSSVCPRHARMHLQTSQNFAHNNPTDQQNGCEFKGKARAPPTDNLFQTTSALM